MEEKEVLFTDQCCVGCLSRNDEVMLHIYSIQSEYLKTMFRGDAIFLCYVCKKMARNAERFIQNVQNNQILLENFENTKDSTFEMIRNQNQPLVSLSHFPLDIIELSGKENSEVEASFTVMEKKRYLFDTEIKVEMKDEEEMSDHLEGEFVDGSEFQDSIIKDEDKFSLKGIVKKELDAEDINLNRLKKVLKARKKVKTKVKTDSESSSDEQQKCDDISSKIKIIFISREQCLEERAKLLQDKKYLSCMYKCEDCIKSFNFKASYDKHLEKHDEKSGVFVCDICKQRWPSMEKLQDHKKYHQIRYKCSECGLTRISRITIKDHYTATHGFGNFQYNCPQCPKSFTRQVSLRKHVSYAHGRRERVRCTYCGKTYKHKEGLKAHIIALHPKEAASNDVRPYVCQECGKKFKAPSQLRNHSYKHSGVRDYYCVECDKSFKTETVLKHHLKTAAPHVNYLELPLSCLHCEKRFAIRRDLDRHTNRVHLNIKPFQCDRCDKAYVNAWSLTQHRRLIHEGYKRPLKYPCTLCDKVFDRNQILKSHIRTHTGERPYQCSKCPAQFSQASVLGTHVRLIHLRLTRDGRPKPNPK